MVSSCNIIKPFFYKQCICAASVATITLHLKMTALEIFYNYGFQGLIGKICDSKDYLYTNLEFLKSSNALSILFIKFSFFFPLTGPGEDK